ncbi:MAG: transposase [Bacteroidota bacterium]
MVGYQDEVWWSRFAQVNAHSWAPKGKPLRLVQRPKRRDDPEPAALACYGVYVPDVANERGQSSMLLRFVRGRPVSAMTTAFLEWACECLAARGVRVWVLVWDNAGWHISAEVRRWLQAHNRTVKVSGEGVRILACGLPSKSPWLNPIEPKWLHGKRATCEPDEEMTSETVMERVCEYYECELLPPLEQKTP